MGNENGTSGMNGDISKKRTHRKGGKNRKITNTQLENKSVNKIKQ